MSFFQLFNPYINQTEKAIFVCVCVAGVVTSCCLVVTMRLPDNQERPLRVTAPAQALRCVHAESISVPCIIHLHSSSPSSQHTNYMIALNYLDTLAVNSTNTLLLSVISFQSLSVPGICSHLSLEFDVFQTREWIRSREVWVGGASCMSEPSIRNNGSMAAEVVAAGQETASKRYSI